MNKAKVEVKVGQEIKIAKFINASTVVVVGGKNIGMRRGTELAIHAQGSPFDIVDPDTEAYLGTVNRYGVRLRVNEVHDNLSIAYITDHAEMLDERPGTVTVITYTPPDSRDYY